MTEKQELTRIQLNSEFLRLALNSGIVLLTDKLEKWQEKPESELKTTCIECLTKLLESKKEEYYILFGREYNPISDTYYNLENDINE